MEEPHNTSLVFVHFTSRQEVSWPLAVELALSVEEKIKLQYIYIEKLELKGF